MDNNKNNIEAFSIHKDITAENALIENINLLGRTGYITISYTTTMRNRKSIMVVSLIVTNDTRLTDQFGGPISARDFRIGMVVNARFSAAMTRSNPPQSRAFAITIVKEKSTSLIEVARVINVRTIGSTGYILTGQPRNPNKQIVFTVSRNSKIVNKEGNRIRLMEILPGQTIRVEREPFQTLSIPPQTPVLWVQIISNQR